MQKRSKKSWSRLAARVTLSLLVAGGTLGWAQGASAGVTKTFTTETEVAEYTKNSGGLVGYNNNNITIDAQGTNIGSFGSDGAYAGGPALISDPNTRFVENNILTFTNGTTYGKMYSGYRGNIISMTGSLENAYTIKNNKLFIGTSTDTNSTISLKSDIIAAGYNERYSSKLQGNILTFNAGTFDTENKKDFWDNYDRGKVIIAGGYDAAEKNDYGTEITGNKVVINNGEIKLGRYTDLKNINNVLVYFEEYSRIYGGAGNSIHAETITGNNVTVNGGNIKLNGGSIIGGYSKSLDENTVVNSNTINITGGSVDLVTRAAREESIIAGGVSKVTANLNTVTISGGNIGVYEDSGTTKYSVNGIVLGGGLFELTKDEWVNYNITANNNAVNISGGTISADIIGGRTAKGQANNNVITITNGDFLTGCRDSQSIDGRIIAGGYTTDGTVQGNTVTISGGKFATETLSAYDGKKRDTLLVAGGYAISAYNDIATVKENKVKISGGVFGLSTNNYSLDSSTEIANGSIFGGMGLMDNYQGNATVTQNLVDISGGTIYGNIFGGYSGSGQVEQNKVKLTGGNFGTADQKINIYAGYSKTGTVSGNSINLSGNLNLANANLYGSNKAGTNNVLNLYTVNNDVKISLSGTNNSTSINTINNFNTINFGDLALSNDNTQINAFLKLSDSSSSNLNNVVLNADSISGTGYLLSGKFSAYGIDTSAIAGVSSASVSQYDETSGIKVSESGGVQVGNTTSQTAVDNYILISGADEAVDKIVAGIYTNKDGNVYVHDNVTGESQATDGKVTISSVAGTVSKIAGAYNVSTTKATNGGELEVTAGNYAVDLHGGWVDNAENTQGVSGNKVTVGSESNKVTVTGNVYGGRNDNRVEENNVRTNKVVIENANITGNVYGGFTKNGSADNNIVTISGSDTFVRGVYGGYSDISGSATVSSNGNTVNILAGTIGNFVYGGYSNGVANNNTVNISGGNLSNAQIIGCSAPTHSNNTLNFFTTDAEDNKSYYAGGNITAIKFFDNINIGDIVFGSTPYVNIVGNAILQSSFSNTTINVGNVIGEGKLFQGAFAANENTEVQLNNKLISSSEETNGIKVAEAKISFGDNTGTVVADNSISVDAGDVHAIAGTYVNEAGVQYIRDDSGNIVTGVQSQQALNITSDIDFGTARICGIYNNKEYSEGDITSVSGGNVTVNDCTVNGTGSIIGAYKYSDASITGNSVTLTNANTNLSIYGGLLGASSSNESEVAENSVTINGGIVGTESKNTDITGGVASGYASVARNSVTIEAGNIYANITGGSSSVDRSTVTENEVIIEGGNVYGRLIGGEFISAADNIVTITGGNIQKFGTSSFDKGIYGAYGGEQGTANLGNNKVNISGGTIDCNVYGAYAGYGTVSSNSVNVSGGTINGDIYGGYNRSASNNSVSISDGKINGKVYAGYTKYSSNQIESNNSVNISGGDLENAALYGGALSATNNNSTLRFYTTNSDNQKTYYAGGSIGAITNFKNIDFGNITLSDNDTKDKAYIKLVSTTVNSKLDNVVLTGTVNESGYLLVGKFSASNVNADALGGFAGINAVKYSDTNGIKVGATKGIEIKSKTSQVVDNYIYYNSQEEDKIYAGIYTDAAGVSKANIDGTVSEGATSGSLTLSSDVDTTTVAVAGAYNEATDITKANATGGTLTLGAGTYTGNFYAGYSQNGTVSDNKIVLQADANVSAANLYGSNKEGGTNNVLDANALNAATSINSINNFNTIKLGAGKVTLDEESDLSNAIIVVDNISTERVLLSGNITGADSVTLQDTDGIVVDKSAGTKYVKAESTNSVTKTIAGGWDVNTVEDNNVQIAIKAGSEGNEIAGLYIASDGEKYSYDDNTSGNATSGTLKLGDVAVEGGKIYAGAYAEAGQKASGGTVEITGGTYTSGLKIYGGYSQSGKVDGNNVNISGGNFGADGALAQIYAGGSSNGIISNNSVNISGGNLRYANISGYDGSKCNDNTLNFFTTNDSSKQQYQGGDINSISNFTTINFGDLSEALLNNTTETNGYIKINGGSLNNTKLTANSVAASGYLLTGSFSAYGVTLGGALSSNAVETVTTVEDGSVKVGTTSTSVTFGDKTSLAPTANYVHVTVGDIKYDMMAGKYINAAREESGSGTLTLSATPDAAIKTVAGAYSKDPTKEVSGGTLNISGGTYAADVEVYGGYSDGGVVKGNYLNISGGTFELSEGQAIQGGYSNKNLAEGNEVSISGTDTTIKGFVYSGYSNKGATNNNILKISDGTIDGTIYGARAWSGDAIGNKVEISGGTIKGLVFGGDSYSNGNEYSNTVKISGGTIQGSVYAGRAYSSEATQQNKIIVEQGENFNNANTLKEASLYGDILEISNLNAGTVIKSVQNFNTINFKDATLNSAISYLTINGGSLNGTAITAENLTGEGYLISGVSTEGVDISAIQGDTGKDKFTEKGYGIEYAISGGTIVGVQEKSIYVTSTPDEVKAVAGVVSDNGTVIKGSGTLNLDGAETVASGAVVAGSYAKAGDAANGTVNITGDVGSKIIYAGYAAGVSGDVTGNTVVVTGSTNLTNATLNANNKEVATTNNVLDLTGWTGSSINEVNRFNTIQMANVDLGAAENALTLISGDLKGTKVDISLKQDTAIGDSGAKVIVGGTFTTDDATSVTINGQSSVDASKVTDTATNGIRVQGLEGKVKDNSISLSMSKNVLVGNYNGKAATDFTVKDTNKGTTTTVVAGGYATSGNTATGGVVTVDGTYTGNLYAGYNEDTSGAVSGNTIKLSASADVSGAILHGTNTAAGTNNKLDINGYTDTIGSVDKFNTINMGTVTNLAITTADLQGTEIVVDSTVNSACTLITGAITSDTNTKVTGFDASAIVSEYKVGDTVIGVTPESELKSRVTTEKVELYRDTTAILAGRYIDGNGKEYDSNNKTLTLASTPADKNVLAGAYAVSGNAEEGIVNITGKVTGTIYAGYAEHGAVNNNTMNISTGVDASGANIYGRNESASGSGNTLNMSGENIKVGVVDRFDTINVGASDTTTSVTVVGEGNKLNAANVVTNGTAAVTGNVEATSVVTNGATTVTGNVKAETVEIKNGATINGSVNAATMESTGATTVSNGVAANTINAHDNLTVTSGGITATTVTADKALAITGNVNATTVTANDTLTVTGKITATEELTTKGETTVSAGIEAGTVKAENKLTVTGGGINATTITADKELDVTGNVNATTVTANDTLNVTGKITATEELTTKGETTVSAGIEAGTVKAENKLTVTSGDIKATTVTADKALDVTGNVNATTVTANDTLTVTGKVTATGELTTKGAATVSAGIEAGTVKAEDQLTVTSGDIKATTVTADKALAVTGNVNATTVTANDTLNVTGKVTATSELTTKGEATVSAGIEAGTVKAENKLTVTDGDIKAITVTADKALAVTGNVNATTVTANDTLNVTGNVQATSVTATGAATVGGNVNATTVNANAGMTANGNVSATEVSVSGGALNLNGTTNTVDSLKAENIVVGSDATVTVNKSVEATSVSAGTGTVNIGTSESAATVNVGTVNADSGAVNINASGNADIGTVNAGTGNIALAATGNINVNTITASGDSKVNVNSGNLVLNSATNMSGVDSNNVVINQSASVTSSYSALFNETGTGLTENASKFNFNGGSIIIDNNAADAKDLSVDNVINLDKLVAGATVNVANMDKLARTVTVDNFAYEAAKDNSNYQQLIKESTVDVNGVLLVGQSGQETKTVESVTIAKSIANDMDVAALNIQAGNAVIISGAKTVTLNGDSSGTLIKNTAADLKVVVGLDDTEKTSVGISDGKGTFNVGADGKISKLEANLVVTGANSTVNTNGNVEITKNVTLEGGKLAIADKLTVNAITAAADATNTVSANGNGLTVQKDLIVVDNAALSVDGNANVAGKVIVGNASTLNIGSNKLGQISGNALEAQGNSVINIGSTNAAGKLTVNNIQLNGGTIFLDPAFVNGIGIEGASSLAVSAANIDGKYIAGQNSVVSFGTMEGATEAFNKFAEVNNIKWAAGGVSAAMYIANNVTLDSGLGGLMVDGSLTSAPVVAAGSAGFADNSLLMVNGSATQSTAAISGAASLNVAGSAKLYIAGAEKENTYKIVEGTGIGGTTNNWAVENVLTDSAKIKFANASTADLVAYNAYSVSIVDAYDGKVIIGHVLDAADEDPLVNAELKQFIDKATSNKTFDEAHQINAMNSLGAMTELGGVSHGTQLAMEELSNIVANSAPLAEDVGGKGVSSKTERSKNVWAKLVHKKDKVDSLNVGGMAANYNFNLNGAVVGSDLYDDGTKSAGVALSYMDGKVSGYNMNVKTRNDAKYYGLAMYGRMQQGKVRMLGDVTYLHGDNDLEQYNVVKALGKAKSDALSVGVRAEADVKLGAGKLTPYVGLRYTRVGIGKYRNSLGLQYDADVQNLVNIPLGLKYSADIKRGAWTVRPSVDIGYVWNLGDRNSTERVSYGNVTDAFGYSSADKGRFVGGVNVAVESANISYSLGYEYSRSSNTKANKFTVGFQWKF